MITPAAVPATIRIRLFASYAERLGSELIEVPAESQVGHTVAIHVEREDSVHRRQLCLTRERDERELPATIVAHNTTTAAAAA